MKIHTHTPVKSSDLTAYAPTYFILSYEEAFFIIIYFERHGQLNDPNLTQGKNCTL